MAAPVLEKLYVEPTEQNRGVGAALLEKAKELRPDGFYLWVFQKNDGARRLYERTASSSSSSPTAPTTWSASPTRSIAGAPESPFPRS